MSRRTRQGFTLVESMVVLALTAIIGTGAIVAMRAGQRHFERTVSNSVVDTKANRTLNKVARRLTGAGFSRLNPAPTAPFASSSLRFQHVTGWNAGDPQWSPEAEFLMEYEPGEVDNGVDDDGDGFIDECCVVQVENRGAANETRTVLVRGVREFLEGEEPDGGDTNGNGLEDESGFCFELQGNALIVRLTVMRVDPEGDTTIRTLQTSISLRN